jgi:putative metal-binding protein
MQMLTCDSCGGLTPRPDAARCLHCDSAFGRRRSWAAILLGPAGAILLAACYGPPGRFQGQPVTPTQADHDGDGSPANLDCDDNDPTRYPGAADPEGDGIDQNCDGVDGWRDPNAKPAIATPPDAGS